MITGMCEEHDDGLNGVEEHWYIWEVMRGEEETTEQPSEHHRNFGTVSTRQQGFFAKFSLFLFSA